MDQREALAQQFITHRHADLGTERARQGFGGPGQIGRPHIVGRRVDQVTPQGQAGGDRPDPHRVGPGRQLQHGRSTGRRLVAGELVAASGPGQRCCLGKRGLHRIQPIRPRRQGQGQRADIRHHVVAKHHHRTRHAAIGAGPEAPLASIAAKARLGQPGPALGRLVRQPAGGIGGVQKADGHGAVGGRIDKRQDGHG